MIGWSTLGGALFMLLTLGVFPAPLLGFGVGTALTALGLAVFLRYGAKHAEDS